MPVCTVVKLWDGQYACPPLELLAALMLDVVDIPPFTVDEATTGDEPCMKRIVSNLFLLQMELNDIEQQCSHRSLSKRNDDDVMRN